MNGKWLTHPVTGTERYATEVLRRWIESGARNLVLHVPRATPVPKWVQGIPVRESRFRGLLFEQVALPCSTAGRFLVSLAGPAPLLKRRQLAVLHDASVFAIPSSYSRRFVLWYRLLYRALGRRAAALATVSRFSAGELARFLKVPEDRFVVAPGSWQHMLGLGSRRPDLDGLPEQYALCVGTVAPHKNVVPTVTAFAEAGVPVVLVAGASWAPVFGGPTALASEDRVLLTGRVDDAELRWLLQHATALVFPSLYEGFGLPVLEAQALGCAVVCTAAASLPEVAGNGVLYFDPEHPERALDRYRTLEDPDLRRQLVELGRANLDRFSWAATARVLADTAGIELTRP